MGKTWEGVLTGKTHVISAFKMRSFKFKIPDQKVTVTKSGVIYTVGERQTQIQWYKVANINSDAEKDKNVVSKLFLVLNLKLS